MCGILSNDHCIDRMLRSVGVGTLPDEVNMLAVDRRLQLKNSAQEKVADFWATVVTDVLRSAFLAFYNKDGSEVMRLTGYNGGQLTLKDINGNNRVYIGREGSTNGGYIEVSKSSGDKVATLYNGNNGGDLWLANNNQDGVFYAFANNGGGGTAYVRDASGNNNISLFGLSGVIECKKVKASEGVVELYDGSLASGSTTFNYGDYNLYIVAARVHTGGSIITMTIPKLMLSGSEESFCISDEADYIVFKLSYSGNTVTLTIGSKNSDGWVEKVYGVN